MHQGHCVGTDEIVMSATLKALRIGVATVGEDLPPPIDPTKPVQTVSRDILQPFNVRLTLRSQPASRDDGARATELRLMLKASPFRIFMSYYILQQWATTALLVRSSILQFQRDMMSTTIGSESKKHTRAAHPSELYVARVHGGGVRDAHANAGFGDENERKFSEQHGRVRLQVPAIARVLHRVGANLVVNVSEVSVCMLADCDTATVGVVFRVTDPSASLTKYNGGFKLLLRKSHMAANLI